MSANSKGINDSIRTPVISASSSYSVPLKLNSLSSYSSREWNVGENLLDSSRLEIIQENVAISRKESGFISSNPGSDMLDQGDMEPMITVPIQLVQIADSSQPSNNGQILQSSEVSNLEANILPSNFNGQLVLRSHSDGSRTIVIDSSSNYGSEGNGGVISVDPKLLENAVVSQTQSQSGREVVLQLDDDINLAQLTNGGLLSSGIILTGNGYQFLQTREPYLNESDSANYSNDIEIESIERDDDVSAPLSSASGQLMVTRLLQKPDGSDIDDAIPDTSTITIDKDQIIQETTPKVEEEPQELGPWVCDVCDESFDRFVLYKKHNKKHVDEKPFNCSECEESFNFLKNLDLHKAIHNKENLQCPECKKEFRRLASLKSHLALHIAEDSVPCEICGDEFYSKSQLGIHMSTHVKSERIPLTVKEEPAEPFNCTICSAVFSTLVSFKNHKLLHQTIKKSKVKRKIKRGISSLKLGGRSCSECGKLFAKPSQLVRHMRIHTGERPYVCNVSGCGRAFNQRGTLLTHMDIHTGKKEFRCELCDKKFSQKSNLRVHIARIHPLIKNERGFFCNECPSAFRTSNSLNCHISRTHLYNVGLENSRKDQTPGMAEFMVQLKDIEGNLNANNTESGSPLKKSTTGKQAEPVLLESQREKGTENLSADGDLLQQALKNSGLSNQAKSVTASLSPDGADGKQGQNVKLITVTDRGQGDVSKRYSVLVRFQDDAKRFVCDFKNCHKEFKKPSDLVRHLRVHTRERPYKCTDCGKAFSIMSTLTSHQKTHSTVRNYVCEVCGKRFVTAASLKTHGWSHTDTKKYQCPLCPKFFRTISHRKAHILSHKQSPHRLHILKKKSMALPDIKLEEPILLTSSGSVNQTSGYTTTSSSKGKDLEGRKFKCSICMATFKKSSHLKQHERIHTGEKPYHCEKCFKSFGSQSALKIHTKVHIGIKPFSCETCKKTFVSASTCKRHLATHSDDRPYMCPYCHNKFKSSTNCKKHMKIHLHELAMNSAQQNGPTQQANTTERTLLSSEIYRQQPQVISENSENASRNTASDPDLESNELQIHATFAQDLVDGSLTLNEFQSKDAVGGDSELAISSHTSLLLPQNETTLSDGSKILVSHSNNDNDSAFSVLPPGVIFKTYECNYPSTIPVSSDKTKYVLENPSSMSYTNSAVQKQVIVTDKTGLTGTIQTVQNRPSIEFHPTVEQSHLQSSPNPTKKDKVYRLICTDGNSMIKGTSLLQSNFREQYTVDSLINTSKSEEFSIISSHSDSGKLFLANSNVGGEVPTGFYTTKVQIAGNEAIQGSNQHLGSSVDSLQVKESSQTTRMGERNQNSQRVKFATPDNSNISYFVENSGSSPSKMGRSLTAATSAGVKENQRPTDSNLEESSSKKQKDHRKTTRRKKIKTEDSKQGKTVSVQGGTESVQFEETLQRGIQSSHPQGQSVQHGTLSTQLSERTRKKNFECSICGQSFSRSYDLKIHQRMHRRTTCKQCGKHTNSNTELKEHMKEHRLRVCSQCQATFSTQNALNSHIKSVHTKEKAFAETSERHIWYCPVCTVYFASSEAIKSHLLSSHNLEEISAAIAKDSDEPPKPVIKPPKNTSISKQIPEPNQEEAKSHNPNAHEMASHSHSHVCSCCGKSFKKPSDLIRHMRTHTGEKPFSCPTCQKSFAVKSTLDVHVKTHFGKKEHKCHLCGTYYATKASLKIHMRLHTGQKPLKCPYCGRHFRTSGHRKVHIDSHFRIQNLKSALVSKKEKPVESQPVQMLTVVPDDNYSKEVDVAENVDVGNELENINSVLINPDGSVTLQISGMNLNELDSSSLLNLQTVGLDDGNLDTIPYVNAVSLEFPAETADSENENQLNINAEATITEGDSFINTETCKNSEEKEYEIVDTGEETLIALEGDINSTRDIVSSQTDEIDGVFTIPYLSIAGNTNGNLVKCPQCPKIFLKLSDLQHHLVSHNIIVKIASDVDQEDSINDQALTIDQFSLVERKPIAEPLNKEYKNKFLQCPYPNCRLSFNNEAILKQHFEVTHNCEFECSICKEVFLSTSTYKHHMETQHLDSKLIKCIVCSREFESSDEMVAHIYQDHPNSIITQESDAIQKQLPKQFTLKGSENIELHSSRSHIDEDSHPLMLKDIFLT